MGPGTIPEKAISSFHTELAHAAKDNMAEVRFQAILTIKNAAKSCFQHSKKYVEEFMPPLITAIQEAPNIKVD